MTPLDMPPIGSRAVERLLMITLAIPIAGGLALASGAWGERVGPAIPPAVQTAETEMPRLELQALQYASLAEANPVELRALEAVAQRMAQAPTFQPQMPAPGGSGPFPTPPRGPQPPSMPQAPSPNLPGLPSQPMGQPQQRTTAPPPPSPIQVQLTNVRVADGATLEADGRRFRLADLVVPGGRACGSINGERVDCGAYAARQLALFVEHRSVECRGTEQFVCRIGQSDVGEWMVRRGLALPDGERYATAASFARSHKLGAWASHTNRIASVQ